MAKYYLPRQYIHGLGITTYDAEASGGTSYSNIVSTSCTYNHDPLKGSTIEIDKLGSVFSIRAYGYKAWIDKEKPVSEIIAGYYEGASRVCAYLSGSGFPMEILALTGFNSSGNVFFYPGHYDSDGSVLYEGSGWTYDIPRADRFYFTPVWFPKEVMANLTSSPGNNLVFVIGTDPTFSKINEDWPNTCWWIAEKTFDYTTLTAHLTVSDVDTAEGLKSAFMAGLATGTALYGGSAGSGGDSVGSGIADVGTSGALRSAYMAGIASGTAIYGMG